MLKNNLYTPITQLPYCCVPACLFMILERRKIIHGSQEEIGKELGLRVPPEKAQFFKDPQIEVSPTQEYGTQVGTPEYSINNFFNKNNIGLKEEYFPAENLGYKQFIENNLESENDIIVMINKKILFDVEGHGHACLIQSIEGENVTLVDPGKDVPKIRVVKLDKLIESMQQKYHQTKKRGGFWIISKK